MSDDTPEADEVAATDPELNPELMTLDELTARQAELAAAARAANEELQRLARIQDARFPMDLTAMDHERHRANLVGYYAQLKKQRADRAKRLAAIEAAKLPKAIAGILGQRSKLDAALAARPRPKPEPEIPNP